MNVIEPFIAWTVRQFHGLWLRATKRSAQVHLAEQLKEIICHNQGKIIQYIFLAGEYHKELKDLLRKHAAAKTSGCSPETLAAMARNIEILQENLNLFLDAELDDACERNFSYIGALFKNTRPKRSTGVRVTLKLNAMISGRTHIETFFPKDRNYSCPTPVEANRASSWIYATGKYYICKNIPYELFCNDYHNPRVISAKNRLKYLMHMFPLYKTHKDWVKLWAPSGSSPSDSCYKSTLVIPITTWGNHFEPEFRKKLLDKAISTDYFANIKREHLEKPENATRMIFGYLCFDSIYTRYFIKALDVPVGYILADILSLYMFTRHMYTELSYTWKGLKRSMPA